MRQAGQRQARAPRRNAHALRASTDASLNPRSQRNEPDLFFDLAQQASRRVAPYGHQMLRLDTDRRHDDSARYELIEPCLRKIGACCCRDDGIEWRLRSEPELAIAEYEMQV